MYKRQERINPTGKKRFKQALIENDMDYIINQGIEQSEAGADILDVNVGLPEIDEPEMLSLIHISLSSPALKSTSSQGLQWLSHCLSPCA